MSSEEAITLSRVRIGTMRQKEAKTERAMADSKSGLDSWVGANLTPVFRFDGFRILPDVGVQELGPLLMVWE